MRRSCPGGRDVLYSTYASTEGEAETVIYCLVGKSCSGKDTLYRAILDRYGGALTAVVPGTTRPRRAGERDGADYRFFTEAEYRACRDAGHILEERQYHTTQGLWRYFTLRFPVEPGRDYLLITTLEGAHALIRHYGAEGVRVVYLTVPDRERLERCIRREAAQQRPDYAEVCRRFLADEQDFSPERLGEFPALSTIDTSSPPEECLTQWRRIFEA